jgi:hypothetical protein
MIYFKDGVQRSGGYESGGARVPRVPVGLPLGQCASSQCGGCGIM